MEEWKWIKFTDLDGTEYDYTNIYEVSNIGRIRGYADKHGKLHSQPVTYFNPKPSKDGYVKVGLRHYERKFFKVHKLVIFMFVGECPKELIDTGEMICINHINEIKHDNRPENLEWCTCKKNVNHGTAIKRRSKTISKPVIATNIETGEQISFDMIKDVTTFFKIGFNTVKNSIENNIPIKGYVLQYK